jgi:vitellogenic carboxypeptidase-like protein
MPSDAPQEDLVPSIPEDKDDKTCRIKLENRSYAGHVDVGSKVYPGRKNHLFYWFFESQAHVEQAPLIIWLNGGPGASSLAGLFLENGPFTIGDDTGKISERLSSWNQEAHVVYWDQPIGTGYSYADPDPLDPKKREYVQTEEALSQMFWEGLRGFFSKHEEYVDCPLYLCGESYAGKYVPAIAKKIDEKNNEGEPKINLKGVAVGNGWITPELSLKIMIDYVYATGLIGSYQKELLYASYAKFKVALDQHQMKRATELGNSLVKTTLEYGGNFDLYDVRNWKDMSIEKLSGYLISPDVKRALHVPPEVEWNFEDNEGPVADNLAEDNMADCSGLFGELLRSEHDYKLLFYTGNFDTACGYRSTEEILSGLDKWGGEEDNKWFIATRLIWGYKGETPKGFVRQHKNLTQISVPNSGHQVPYFRPEICREMIYNWIFDRPFPGYVPRADPPPPKP